MAPMTVRGLTAGELLDVWEAAWPLAPPQRTLALLAAARRDRPAAALAERPVGEGDAALLALRAATFGPRLAVVADCPRCGGGLEAELDVEDLLNAADADPDDAYSVDEAGVHVRFRLPTHADLGAIVAAPDAHTARARLLARCVLEARRGGRRLPAGELPAAVETAVDAVMADADPGADLRLATACPACDDQVDVPLDVALLLWAEVDACARRLLGEVHALAAAYGWLERDILALSPWRRQIYLEALE